jgi:hypothetical protein
MEKPYRKYFVILGIDKLAGPVTKCNEFRTITYKNEKGITTA